MPLLPQFRCPCCEWRRRRGPRGEELEVESIEVEDGPGTGRSPNGVPQHRTTEQATEEADASHQDQGRRGRAGREHDDRQANRADFDRAGVAVVNLMSAPGAGKTTLLERALAERRDVRVGVLEGDVQGSIDADRISGAPRPGRPAQHRRRLRRRMPPRRQHGPLGPTRAAARRPRPARHRERRQPRLPGRVPGRRGRQGDGLLGHRGRGQAAQVPADVPHLRASSSSTRSTCSRTSTSTSTCCCTTSARSIPRRG